ncbi:hypothetical protein [Pseudonocardia zijingensis]|uniref:Uncharacterized protein n=1 Tax=Pseudonocardia zijingensis TaxID=153376 RepID=A0ABN1N8S3_9PSEU
MSNPRFTIAQLRAELQELAESVTGYAPPPKPDRFDSAREDAAGPIWLVPGSPLPVRAVDSEPGAVFIEGADFSYHGDWQALASGPARSFAMALLAAADWADGHDALGQRRARKDTT